MILTFPNMGNVAIAARALCQGLKIPYVMPEKNNKGTLRLGAYYSPEEICLPFKIMLGNAIECIERGADTFLITGSCGPCRFGEYCELLMKILPRLGYDKVDFIVIDFSPDIGREEAGRRLNRLWNESQLPASRKLTALKDACRIEKLCDEIDSRARHLSGYELNRGECRRLLSECKAEVIRTENPKETVRVLKSYRKKINGISLDRSRDPLKIAIIGEIYTVIEPFSNLYLEDRLMEYGVSTERTLTPTWWLRNLMLKPLGLNYRRLNRAADRFLPFTVGGHGRECVGEAALAAKRGLDGAIQLLPLGCMPEVIAKSVLTTIQRENDFPIMTLVVDEVTGEAGFVTRVEAFLDMLESRRSRKRASNRKRGSEMPERA